jgi:putative membrane protein
MSDLNDPRVFFAAERTLLAWNRTSLTLMAFGFVIERFGLFVHMLLPQPGTPLQRGLSFWIGLAFILIGSLTATAAVVQFRRVLHTFKPSEIPAGYFINLGSVATGVIAAMGAALTAYLFHGQKF